MEKSIIRQHSCFLKFSPESRDVVHTNALGHPAPAAMLLQLEMGASAVVPGARVRFLVRLLPNFSMMSS